MTKEKKQTVLETPDKENVEEISYETRLKAISEISHPLASKKLNKKLLKVVKKGSHSY